MRLENVVPGSHKPPVKFLPGSKGKCPQTASSTSPRSWCCCARWDGERTCCVRPAAALEETEGSDFGVQAAAVPMEQSSKGRCLPRATASPSSGAAWCCLVWGSSNSGWSCQGSLPGQSLLSVSEVALLPSEALSTLARTQPSFSCTHSTSRLF